MSALKPELNRLPRLNSAVPTQARCCVGITAADGGIPGAAQAGGACVSPTDIPPVDGTGALVGNANRAGKS